MNIGILGGTFDPIHQGHLTLARRALKQFKLNQVLFIPAARPPHKKKTRSLTPIKHRFEMVRLVVKACSKFKVSKLEMKRKGPSYTVDTLKSLQKKFPKAKLYLILGQDAYAGVDEWKQPETIRLLAHFIVAKRPGDRVAKKTGGWVSWIRMPLCPISSSEIRKTVKCGRELDDYLPQAVNRYIQRHRLYRRHSL